MKSRDCAVTRTKTVVVLHLLVLTVVTGILLHENAAASDGGNVQISENAGAEVNSTKRFPGNDAAEEQDSKTIAAKISIEPSVIGRVVNKASQVNPDNTIYIDDYFFATESFISVNDYFDASRRLRWWLKSYSLYSQEKNSEGGRVSDARLDEAFIDYTKQNYFASIGKRRMYWGHALFFSAVNVIVPQRDPLDPNRATEGFPLGWIGYSNNYVSVDLVGTRDFDEYWSSELNRWGAKVGFAGDTYDFAFYYFDGERYKNNRRYETMIGASGSMKAVSSMTAYAEMAVYMHNNRNYYSPAGMTESKNTSYMKAIVGANIIIHPESFLSFSRGDASANLEIYYNQSGYSDNELANYYDAIPVSSVAALPATLNDYQILQMNKLYSLISYNNNFKERYTTTATAIVADDLSLSSLLAAEYHLSDYYTFRLSWAHAYGNRQSEFGNAPVTDIFQFRTSIYF